MAPVPFPYLLSRQIAPPRRRKFLDRLLLLTLFLLSFDHVTLAQTDAVTLAVSKRFQNLSDQLYCLDQDLSASAPGLSTPPDWRPCKRQDLFIQPPKASPWLRITLTNGTDISPWLLKIDGHHLAHVDVYRELASGHYQNLSAVDQSLFLYPLEMDPAEQTSLLLKARADFDSFLQLKIGAQNQYYQDHFWTILIQGFFLGTLIIMLLYNFCLYLWLKEKNYRCYSLYLLSVIIYVVADSGLGRQYLWPDWSWLRRHDYTLFAAFSFTAATLFIRRFLQLRMYRGWVYQLSNIFLCAWITLTLCSLVLTTLAFRMTLYSMGFLSLVAGLITSLYLWQRGSLQARQYTIAYIVLYIGTTIHILGLAGLIPWTSWTEYAQLIGFTVEFALLSLALADAMNRSLENRVSERTTALEQALDKLETVNYELANQSLTDPLTAIYNRRYFDQVYNNELQRGIRSNLPLSILMIDIDHFKSVNDRFGHLQGDECLRLIAKTLDNLVERSNDLLARYGGEEFVILLPGTSQDHAVIFAERVLTTVRNTPFAVNDLNLSITVSIGVAGWIPAQGEDIETLQAAADKALYQAKAAGRNCIRTASETDRPNLQLQLLQ